MGNFQAFNAETDQPVSFTGDAISVATSLTASPDIANYYKSILKKALKTFSLASTESNKNPTKKISKLTDFETKLKDLWGTPLPSPLGYILEDDSLSKDEKTLYGRIAQEENRYYWKWLENGQVIQDNDTVVLNQLRMVNARLLNKIFLGRDVKGRKLWKEQELEPQDNTLIAPAIAISEAGSYTTGQSNYYGVYVNTKARLLFLDRAEETSIYKYGIRANSTTYETKRTFLYNQSKVNSTPTADGDFEYYFLGEDLKDYRYLIKLKEQINSLAALHGKNNVTGIRVSVLNVENNQANRKKRNKKGNEEGNK